MNKLGKKKPVASVSPKNNVLSKTSMGVVGRFIFLDFCKPAKVYLVISLIILMYYVYTDQDFIWVALKAIIFVVWGFGINKLCLQDLKAISWILAIIPPFVFLFFTIKVPPAVPNAPKAAQTQ